ncbi:MAG: gamma-glutamylcyclotransferase family protein [Caulobacteraceae bacterium]
MTTPSNDQSMLLFSYGTLQDAQVQRETFGRLLTGRADALPGYRRGTLRITSPEVVATSGAEEHPVVEPTGDPDDLVEGTVFEITPEELAAADVYEAADYRRIAVRLRSGTEAWLYVRR